MALYTYRPTKGLGKDLPEAELEEFNSITYERIANINDINKLLRLEQYMREEEFIQTSQLARKRIVELGGKDNYFKNVDLLFCNHDDKYDEFLLNFNAWQDSMKRDDYNLIKMDECELEVKLLSNHHLKRTLINDNSMNEKAKVRKKDIYSECSYYKQWKKNIGNAKKNIEFEEKKIKKHIKETWTSSNKNYNNKDTFKNKTMQERLLATTKTKSLIEKRWLAEREREKGNDLFKAKEYNASIDAYSIAIDLFPDSPLAYGNRAASNIKIRKWEDVVKDCSTAIKLDKKYMKAYMRRGLANLEMENPQEAIIDLQKALELDHQNQELQTIIRRTECMLKKLKEKELAKIELQRQRKKEVELQRTKEEIETFKNMINSSTLSNTSIRMIIQQEDDSKIEATKDENFKNIKYIDIKSDKSCMNNNELKLIESKEIIFKKTKAKKIKKTFRWLSKQHKLKRLDDEFINEKNIQSYNFFKIKLAAFMFKDKEINLAPDNSKKQLFKFGNDKSRNETIVDLMKDKIQFNKILNNYEFKHAIFNFKHNTFINVFGCQSMELDYGSKKRKMDLKLCNIDLLCETIKMKKSRELILIDYLCLGQTSNRNQQIKVLKIYLKLNVNSSLKILSDILTKKWHLNNNIYFNQDKFYNDAKCYIINLKYCERSAEGNASHVILMDCTICISCYHQVLAQCISKNLQSAKEDFELYECKTTLHYNSHDIEIAAIYAKAFSKYVPINYKLEYI